MAPAIRGPGGRFLSKAERAALADSEPDTDTGTKHGAPEKGQSNMSETNGQTIEFVDELPTIQRHVEHGVWAERLAPLRDNPGRWAKVYGPTPSPHAMVQNLNAGPAGVDPDEYEFAGRMLDAPEDTPEDKIKNGKTGFVYARFLTEEQREERDRKRREAEAEEAALAAAE